MMAKLEQMSEMNSQAESTSVRARIDMAIKVIRLYDWLLDLYVLDFFVDDHWNRLSKPWRDCFQNMDPKDLGKILLGIPTNHVLPLSFMCLLKCIKMLSLPRKMQYLQTSQVHQNKPNHTRDDFTCATHPRLKNLFLKHIKLKKRHEISVMSDVVGYVALQSNCKTVIDFGSGLGHLMRVLTYKNEIQAAGIECQHKLTDEARKLDDQLEYTAKKFLTETTMSKLHRPIHLNMLLSSDEQLQHVPLPATISKFGLIGLHPCGDLGPLLLRNFINNPKVQFICVIHAYRAALERILVETDSKLKHAPVRNIKHSDEMTFERYAVLALHRVNIPLPLSDAVLARAERDLSQWRRVVALYTLRLALAPLVETVVLMDRVLYVLEHGTEK